MAAPTARQLTLIKLVLFLLSLLPLARMAWLVAGGELVEPLEFLTHGTGDWTLYFLTITLAVTPLRRLSGQNWLIKLRRMLGLFAFLYASLHLLTFVWFDHFFDLADMLKDILKRPFILVGFMAFLLLVPLAVTSTQAMQRRLGGKLWQAWHRLIYLAVPLGVLHFWWMKAAKHNLGQPLLFAVLVTLLLALRVYWLREKVRSARLRPR